MAIRLHLQHKKVTDIKTFLKPISFTLEEFMKFLADTFSLKESEAVKVARYIFEKDAKVVNGKVEYNKDKSLLTTKLVQELRNLISLEGKLKVNDYS